MTSDYTLVQTVAAVRLLRSKQRTQT